MKIGRQTRPLISALLSAFVLCASVHAQTQAQPDLMVVSIILNSQQKGDLFVLRTADDDFLVRKDDLLALGLQELRTGSRTLVEGVEYISLRSAAGIRYQFNERQLALEITADPALLPRTTISAGGRDLTTVPLRQNSAFVNYAFTRSGGTASNPSNLSAEAGVRLGKFLVVSDATSSFGASQATRTVRLMTSAIRDDDRALQRWTIGDFFTAPADLGTSVNLGGLRLAKYYGLDPSLKVHPLGIVTGQVSLPSEVDVIVNGQRVRTERIQPGEFEIRDLAGYRGAQAVQLVVRDAFGRSQQLDYALYLSEDPLRQGLHDYSYAIGALRRRLGRASNAYGPIAFSAFHKYGFTDALTLGWRGEGRKGLLNVGPTGTFVLGTAGVVNLSLVESRAAGRAGRSGLARYAYKAGSFALGASLRADSRSYAPLRDHKIVENRRWEGTFFASHYWPQFGSLTVSHSQLAVRRATATPEIPGFSLALLRPQRLTTVAYHTSLPWRETSLSVNLSRIRDDRGPRTELSFGLRVRLDGRRSVTTTTRRSSVDRYDAVGLTQTVPVGEGWGYDVAADRQRGDRGNAQELRARTQVNTHLALLRADYTRSVLPQRATAYSVSASGGAAWVGGRAYLGRPVDDSFGVVKVDQVPGIPVSVNGLAAGKTDQDGLLFVPSLTSFYPNQITIDARAVPIEYTVRHVTRRVTFPTRSGAVIDFEARRVQAITGFLVGAQPERKPVGLAEIELQMPEKKIRSNTGPTGEIYFENLPHGEYAGRALLPTGSCEFAFKVPVSTALFVEVGDLTCK